MNTKMLHDRRHKRNAKPNVITDADSPDDEMLEKKGSSGALLDMLAEVASQTLHSDPSVKVSPIKRSPVKTAEIVCQFSSKKKQRIGYRSRNGEKDTMDLEQIRSLTANHLLKLFSEFDGDEIRRLFTFTCYMEPEQCHQQFSSFGSEGKARQQMKSHLLEHVHQMELKAKRGFQCIVESVKVRRRRLAEKLHGSHRRSKLVPKIKVEPNCKLEPSDENDSSLPNKENNVCLISENFELLKTNLKTEKLISYEKGGNLNENNIITEMESDNENHVNGIYYDSIVQKICDTEEKNKSKNDIYDEHNYILINTQNNIAVTDFENYRKCNWTETKIKPNGYSFTRREKQEKIVEEPVSFDKAPAGDLGKFMMAETLLDMVMVCVMEDDQLQLKQLPCVGQEVDVNTCDSLPCRTIRSDELPVVQDNRKSEFHYYNNEVMQEINCEKNIERDEYIQKKKPKGKAKFIGQSKAEKEMAIHLIETMKRKGNAESLECHICKPPRSFTAPTTLISHYRSHAGIKPYECRICHSVFTRQHSLNYHMLIHSNQTRFTCADCGRKFRHPSHFKEHRRRHTGESPYECSDCLLRFKTRNTYKRHLKTRHGKVLTTSGGLIILSEEEFRRVRTLPRSPQGTPIPAPTTTVAAVSPTTSISTADTTNALHLRQNLYNGKKRARKSKGRIKIGGKRKKLELFEGTNEETEETLNFNFNEETKSDIAVTRPVIKTEEENTEAIGLIDSSCVSNSESKVTLPVTEPGSSQKTFQDIVEEAMRQSNISFTDDPENDKANVVVLDVPVANTETIYSTKGNAFEYEHSTQQSDVPTINIKSSWNTVKVQLKRSNEKMWIPRSKPDHKSVCKSGNNKTSHLQPKTCKKTLILPNTIEYDQLVFNTDVHQLETLSTVIASNVHTSFNSSTSLSSSSSSSSSTSSSPSLSSLLSPPCATDKENPVSSQLDTDILNVVGSDGLSIISTTSQEATIMILPDDCNSFTTVPNQNYILNELKKSTEEIGNVPQM